MLSAIEPQQKHSRPLFALLEKGEEDYTETTFEQLTIATASTRFLIPLTTKKRTRPTRPSDRIMAQRSIALCQAITRITNDCREHRAQWLQKPKFKKIQVSIKPPDPYFHYEYVSVKEEDTKSQPADPLLAELFEELPAVTRPK